MNYALDFVNRRVSELVQLAAWLLLVTGLGLASVSAWAVPLDGDQVGGTISTPGEVDEYTFDAVAGGGIVLRLADLSSSSFFPLIELFDPSGSSVAFGQGQTVGTIVHTAAASGTYRLLVRDNSSSGNGVGAYTLHLARMSDANELGLLANDSDNQETISIGDLDTYTLSANSGDSLILRLADTSGSTFFPLVELYDPNGARVAFGQGQSVGTIVHAAAGAGTYRVLVRDNSSAGSGAGNYNLRFARMRDANELGTLANDSDNLDTIELGDLDTYTLTANLSDTLILRVGDTSGTTFFPLIELYDPSGTRVAFGQGQNVGSIVHTATNAGEYRVIVRDNTSAGSGVGNYNLRFARMTDANELGELANDSDNLDTIELGDLDTYTLTADASDVLVLRVADTSGTTFFPLIELYDPSGTRVAFGQGQNVGSIVHIAADAGNYRVIVRDNTSGGSGVGDYNLRFARMVDANELGELVNDGDNLDTIELGDLDTYTLAASAGDRLVLRVADLSGTTFFPLIELYDPAGVRVELGQGQNVGTILHTATATGTYRVLVRDNTSGGSGVGNYNLRVAQMPGANELGLIPSGASESETIDLGDLDTFTLNAGSAAQIALQIEDLSGATFFPRVELYSPSGALVAAASGQSIGSTTYQTTQSGIFTLLVRDDSSAGSGVGDYLLGVNVSGGNGDGPTYTIGITPPAELNLDGMDISQGRFILERVVGYSASEFGAELLMNPIVINATIGGGLFNPLLDVPTEFEVLNLIGRFEATNPAKPPARFDLTFGPVATTGPVPINIALPLFTADTFYQITDLNTGADTYVDGNAVKPEVSLASLFENIEIFDGRDTWFVGYPQAVVRGPARPGQPHGRIGTPSNAGSTPVNSNEAPVVLSDSVTINAGEVVDFTFIGSDPEQQELVWSFVDIIGAGVLNTPQFDPSSRQVLWDSTGSPAPGTYLIRVMAVDPGNLGALGILTVDVLGDLTVPNVVGQTLTDAEAAITAAGFVAGTVSEANSSTVAAGSVISQTPIGGSSATLGSSVDLVISLGVANVLVPNVVDLAQVDAEANIVTAGLLVGAVTNASSASVPVGAVISQTPIGGASVAPDSAVNLVISTGTATVMVPSVIGLVQAEAQAAIVSAGLIVGNVTVANSNSVAAGLVISQQPVGGSSVALGTAVDLVISLGVADVSVPNVVGLPQANAELVLVGANLIVGSVTTANSDTIPTGSVINQQPVAGSSVPVGTAIDLVVSVGSIVQPLACDADANGSVDRFDIRAISLARGQTALPGDVRDVNGDGVISIADARACVTRCTNARCAP